MAQNVLPPEISEAMGKLIDTRGAVLIAFAQVEWFLAKIVAIGATYDQYKHLDLSFSQDAEKRAQRLREIPAVEGPFSKYADALTKTVNAVLGFARLRNFCAHGLLVRPDDLRLDSKMHFRMFRMYQGGRLTEETLDLTIKEFTERERGLMTAAKEFVGTVRAMWQELGLPPLDDPKEKST